MVYQAITLVALSVCLLLRAGEGFGVVTLTPGLWWFDLCLLGLAAAVVVGLFPFHGWVLPFLGAPRSSIFLPMLCVETGLLFFFRILAPMVIEHSFATDILMPFPVIGLLYASLLFFSEQRLKRIPACLYLSHVSLMALGALGLGHLGIAASMLDGINVLIAVLGLMAVCALLTSRFGIRGVWAPTGLGVMFPELAVCYLVCVLSLVGFPGTLGFIEEELLLGHGIDRHKFLVSAIAVALTLNGFTSFRLFARVFYGQPFSSRDPASALLLRERLMMLVIVALIVVNGVAPAFLVRTLTALSS
jgi:NADH-quinone oxidoreductase subunit M